MQLLLGDIVNEEPPELNFTNIKWQNISNQPNWLVWALILIAAGGGAFLAMGW